MEQIKKLNKFSMNCITFDEYDDSQILIAPRNV